jgi:hypothetical protein
MDLRVIKEQTEVFTADGAKWSASCHALDQRERSYVMSHTCCHSLPGRLPESLRLLGDSHMTRLTIDTTAKPLLAFLLSDSVIMI